MTALSYQLYSSRNFGPIDATLAMVAEAGYRHVEGFGGLYPDAAAATALRAAMDASDLQASTAAFMPASSLTAPEHL